MSPQDNHPTVPLARPADPPPFRRTYFTPPPSPPPRAPRQPSRQPPPWQPPRKKPLLDVKQLIIAAVSTLTCSLLGSFFSVAGTQVGAMAGVIMYGIVTALYEFVYLKASERVRSWPRRTLIMVMVGTAAGGGLLGAALTTGAEAATGQTVHGLVTHSRSYGLSFAGDTSTKPPSPVTPAPSYSYRPSDPPSSSSPAAVIPPAAPSASFSPAATATAASVPSSAIAPGASASQVPSAQPSAAPSQTAAPASSPVSTPASPASGSPAAVVAPAGSGGSS